MYKHLSNVRCFGTALVATLLFSSCQKNTDLTTPVAAETELALKPGGGKGNNNGTVFYALTAGNELVKYSTDKPFREQGSVALNGLPEGERILAIDFRPATGQLYGVSSGSRLYIINQNNGRTTAVSTMPFSPAINGSLVGFDFNPTVDRIRLVTDNDQNLRLNPETGALAAMDTDINPGTAAVSAVAYTNNFAGTGTTTLYDIDIATDQLYVQNPPNNGTLVAVGKLGVMATGEGGFDISPDNSLALAALFGRGDDDDNDDAPEVTPGNKYRFYSINLQTGQAKNLGKTSRTIIGVAIPTAPVAYAVNESNGLIIFNPETGVSVTKPIGVLQTGETILGIDMRPANGQLFALGSSSRLYTINASSGIATVVNGMPFTPALSGTSFGLDFNPTVDRIRVVSNSGQNLRLNPVTGAALMDGGLNPGSPMVDAAAYTNNFAGATITTLYDIDVQADVLYTQNPPNNGTLVSVGPLGVNVTAQNGFDIGGTTGNALAIFTTGSSTGLYSINLASGAATYKRAFASKVNGFAIGLGF